MSIDCLKKAAKQIIVKKDQYGDTLVHFAALYYAIDILKLFVNEFSADVTGVNIHGRQPLHEVIEDLECVKFLCHHSNIDVNCIKHGGWTPLMISGHLALVKYFTLLSSETVFTSSNSGRLPIHTAALYKNFDIVLFFLGYFSNSNLHFYNTAHLDILLMTSDNSGINLFQNANKLGRQAIHHSAMTGNAEKADRNLEIEIEIDVDVDVDVDARDEWDLWTPLHFAAKEGHEKIFALLVNQYKARKDIRDRHGRTVLDIGIV
ncbi:hypothetical protein G9A89_004357 [Geosiphon pyriformis]|nr:hypothetical protein G9A89_004357 [Geosiphon pyriformis]